MVRSLGLTLCLLGGCNIDRLAAEFHVTEPPAGSSSSTGGPGSSTSTGDTSGSSASAASGTTTIGDTSTGHVDDTTGESSTSETVGSTTTTGPASVCGNANVEEAEEYDQPGDPTCSNCFRDRIVFVTSQEFNGDWAGGNFDYWCNHLAAVAGLLTDPDKRFKPWVSTSTASPADRLFHSPGRYVLRNGLVFAESWSDLVAGNIVNALEVDENSQTRVVSVWTDAFPDGTAILPDGGDHCGDWTKGGDGLAYFGDSSAVDGEWTLYDDPVTNPTPCGGQHALYCFESP